MNREWTEILEATCADKPLLSDGMLTRECFRGRFCISQKFSALYDQYEKQRKLRFDEVLSQIQRSLYILSCFDFMACNRIKEQEPDRSVCLATVSDRDLHG